MSSKDKPEFVTLSASRINTLNKCAWTYHCNYVLRLPDEGNDGARRGTVTHNVLECLLRPRHRHHFDIIMGTGDVESSRAVTRLAMHYAKQIGVDDKENFELIKSFILVGLRTDFFCEGIDENGEQIYGTAKLLPPEEKFDIINSEPKYKILGFIDKICLYPDTKTIRIVDYKTSKQKFSGEDKDFNIQAMMYSLAAGKLYPDYERIVCEFQFLKFPRSPSMICEYTNTELRGLEHYLEHLNEFLVDFDMDRAKANYAWDSIKTKWLCGKRKGELNKAQTAPAFICRYKYPYEYFAAIKEDGSVARCSMEKTDKFIEWAKENEYGIEQRRYGGCPKFKFNKQGDLVGINRDEG